MKLQDNQNNRDGFLKLNEDFSESQKKLDRKEKGKSKVTDWIILIIIFIIVFTLILFQQSNEPYKTAIKDSVFSALFSG